MLRGLEDLWGFVVIKVIVVFFMVNCRYVVLCDKNLIEFRIEYWW